jgi:hypothetical protein
MRPADADRVLQRFVDEPQPGYEHLRPITKAMTEQRAALLVLQRASCWPQAALQACPAPLCIMIDDRTGAGPAAFKAIGRAQPWLRGTYLAVGCRPDGDRLLDLTLTYSRLLVIETSPARAIEWARFLGRCPLRRHGTLRAPGAFMDRHGLAERRPNVGRGGDRHRRRRVVRSSYQQLSST